MFTVGSLFSGVGGLDLGLERAGVGRVVWQCESDPAARRVLARHWPGIPIHPDVREVSRATVAPVDILCGGFPCQDVSVAGLGAGLDGARSGLWHEFARVIEELRPKVVVVENVAALVARGLDRIVARLRGLDYRVAARLLRASDVGAPHRRERIFVVAYAADGRLAQWSRTGCDHDTERSPADRSGGHVWPPGPDDRDGWRDYLRTHPGREPAVPNKHGRPWLNPRFAEALMGFPAAWTVFEPRKDRLRCLGNAVVPQVSEEVGRFVVELLQP